MIKRYEMFLKYRRVGREIIIFAGHFSQTLPSVIYESSNMNQKFWFETVYLILYQKSIFENLNWELFLSIQLQYSK